MLQTSKNEALGWADTSTHYAGGGAVSHLEAKLRRHYGMEYALCVSSATSGLLCLALALDLRRKSFIAPPLTYGGSLSSWLLLENRPVFADLDRSTLTIDPASVRKRIRKETAAILAVDLFGVPCDSAALREVADEFGLWYILDAAQSLGAFRNGAPSGTAADAVVVSFTIGKTVSAGEGGAILTNNSDLYEKLIWHGQHPDRQHRDLGLQITNEFALNARMHPAAAEYANSEFESSLSRLKTHRENCWNLIETLNGAALTEAIRFREQGIEPTFSRLSATWKRKQAEVELVDRLNALGWSPSITPIPYSLLYRHPAFLAQYSGLVDSCSRCPVAESQIRRRLCLTATQQCKKQSRSRVNRSGA